MQQQFIENIIDDGFVSFIDFFLIILNWSNGGTHTHTHIINCENYKCHQ